MNPKEETRIYKFNECISFRKTSEKYGGLSNMASGYPIVINGIYIKSSEALYQAMRFPHLPEVQMIIINESSPMTAKMKSKKISFTNERRLGTNKNSNNEMGVKSETYPK